MSVESPVEMPYLQQPHFRGTLRMLRQNGYVFSLSLQDNHIYCSRKGLLLQQHEFDINGMYYFPPCETIFYERMIYTIDVFRHSFRGTLLMTGAAHESVFTDMINRKLQDNISRQRIYFDHGIL